MKKTELVESLGKIADMERECARIVSGFFSEDADEDERSLETRKALRDIGNAAVVNERTISGLVESLEEADIDEL
jgi:hypothetical protein